VIPWIRTAIRGERSMMGRRERGQGQFFYAFDLDKVVPADHLVREIDAFSILIGCTRSLRPTTRTQVGLRLIRC
jgi:hypothetical protein